MTKFLRFSVKDRGDRIKLHNAPMVQWLLEFFKTDQCRPSRIPLPLELDLSSDTSEKLGETTPYRPLVGALLHLAHTVRRDMSYAVGYLSHFLCSPTEQLWRAVKYVLRYLKGTGSPALVFRAGGE